MHVPKCCFNQQIEMKLNDKCEPLLLSWDQTPQPWYPQLDAHTWGSQGNKNSWLLSMSSLTEYLTHYICPASSQELSSMGWFFHLNRYCRYSFRRVPLATWVSRILSISRGWAEGIFVIQVSFLGVSCRPCWTVVFRTGSIWKQVCHIENGRYAYPSRQV